jgi:hypothetical protein
MIVQVSVSGGLEGSDIDQNDDIPSSLETTLTMITQESLTQLRGKTPNI